MRKINKENIDSVFTIFDIKKDSCLTNEIFQVPYSYKELTFRGVRVWLLRSM